MLMLDKTKLLVGAYYLENPKFAQIDEIFKYIDDDGKIITKDLDNIQIDFLENQTSLMRKSYFKLRENQSMFVNMKIEDFYQLFEKMINCYYNEFDLKDCEKPNIKIVKEFPHPFEKVNFKAMTFNEFQAKEHNCEKGIYLLEKYLAHGISEIMIAHELMHFIIGIMTPNKKQISTAPFMEEGIVDILGLYFLFKYNLINKTCIQNWISFGRANCEKEYIGSIYFREAKQLLWIIKTCGIEKAKELARAGQENISKIDMKEYFNKKTNIEYDETLNQFISIYDYAFINFNLNVKEFYLFSKLLDLNNGIELSNLFLNNINKLELDDIINSLVSKGLMYIYGEKLFNPNKAILDTIKITLF